MTEDETEREQKGPRLLLPLPSNVIALQSTDRREKLRIVEALLFAASEPLDEAVLARHFVEGEDVRALLEELQANYAGRGVNLVRVAGKWAFRTAEDLSFLLEKQAVEQRRLSRAALETLAIIAYHQPVTRAEIEEIRGVCTSKGTIDVLLETGLDQAQRPPSRAWPPRDLRHDRKLPRAFRLRSDPGSAGSERAERGRAPRTPRFRPASPCPIPTMRPTLRDDEEPLEDETPGDDPLGEDDEG